MHILKYNKYTHRYYSYNTEDIDLSAPMFDEKLHNNDIDFERPFHRNMCQYCGTKFNSRNELFYHLGFMNINIGRRKRNRFFKYKGKNEVVLIKRSRYDFTSKSNKKRSEIDVLENMMNKKLKI